MDLETIYGLIGPCGVAIVIIGIAAVFMLCSGLADSKAATDIHLRKNGIEDTTATMERRHMPPGRQYTGNWRHVILNTVKSLSMPTIRQRYSSIGLATPWAATVMSSSRPQAG